MSTKESMGLLLVLLGVVMQLLGIAYWLGWIRPPKRQEDIAAAGWSDVFKELIKVAPWIVVVGVINVFIGAVLLGATFVGQTS